MAWFDAPLFAALGACSPRSCAVPVFAARGGLDAAFKNNTPFYKSGKAAQAKKREKREIDRKSRNRESAALSRLRKKLYTTELENKVKELTTTNAELAARVAALERLTDALAQQVAVAHSDPVAVEATAEANARAREAAQVAEVAAVNGYARSTPVVAPVGQHTSASMALDALMQPQPFTTANVEQMTYGGDMRGLGLTPVATSTGF